ncbi:hypothetical protein BC834DRAFT_974975 [Gloeopeniophorella convolvens]|nr:hypothetical protein BC834DRAFT_974975 [Gloeopeniophorella convolvens]
MTFDAEVLVNYICTTLGLDLNYTTPFAVVPKNGREIYSLDDTPGSHTTSCWQSPPPPTPGHDELHHHLGLLSRETRAEELRGVYHSVKRMIAIRPFETARESVLPVQSPAAQARRSAPDARTPELFVVLHGMLCTDIQLDDCSPILEHLPEVLLEYGCLCCIGTLSLLDSNPAAIAAAVNVAVAATFHYSRSTVEYYQGIFQRFGSRGSTLTVVPFN